MANEILLERKDTGPLENKFTKVLIKIKKRKINYFTYKG